jgi:hypothetical protein
MVAALRAAGFIDASGFITLDGNRSTERVEVNPMAFPT